MVLLLLASASCINCTEPPYYIALHSTVGVVQGLLSAIGYSDTGMCFNSTYMVMHIIEQIRNFKTATNKLAVSMDIALAVVNIADVCRNTVPAFKALYNKFSAIMSTTKDYEDMIIDIITELVDLYPDVKIAVFYYSYCQFNKFGEKIGNIIWSAVLRDIY
jgi:hypothetical protein